jgi:hypothetical protein
MESYSVKTEETGPKVWAEALRRDFLVWKKNQKNQKKA